MKLDSSKWRYCKAIACDSLEGYECGVDECEHPDVAASLEERRRQLKEAKHGRDA